MSEIDIMQNVGLLAIGTILIGHLLVHLCGENHHD